MRAADGDGHSTDPHRKWISRDKPGTVERLDGHAFIKTQFSQPPTITWGKRRPVDRADRSFVLKGEVCKSHLRPIISIV